MMTANEIKNYILVAVASGGSVLAHLLGGWDTGVQVLITLMAIDYVCGLLVAGYFKKSGKSENGALDSRAGYAGLMKKMGILLAVLLSAALDRYLAIDFARNAVILFYILNEALSVIENLAIMGVPFPDRIKNALEQMKTDDATDNQLQ